jgi:aspartate/glutamate racemase
MDPVPFYRDVVLWFRDHGITHGSVGCNTFNDIGMQLFKEHGIVPVNSITDILFDEMKKYSTVGWVSTSLFKNRLPADIGGMVKHISEADQRVVDSIIFNELAWNKVSQASIETLRGIVKSLHCPDVVFGCTDLSLMCDHMDCHIIDSVQLHIQSFH